MPTPDAAPLDWSRKLARVLVLDNDTKLVTLRDAANVLTERFGTVTSWRVVRGSNRDFLEIVVGW